MQHYEDIYKTAKANIKPDDRIIMAKKNILPARFPVSQHPADFDPPGKPKGLWYAVGAEWIDWCKDEMPHWIGDKFYKIEITDKVLRITNVDEFKWFCDKFGYFPEYYKHTSLANHYIDIDWMKVAEEYPGIEIAPHQYSLCHEYNWYYGWDVASGCVWDESAIKSLKRLRLKKPKN